MDLTKKVKGRNIPPFFKLTLFLFYGRAIITVHRTGTTLEVCHSVGYIETVV